MQMNDIDKKKKQECVRIIVFKSDQVTGLV